jgi:putative tryptophan/tyrosine transport system substrate-binding protein
MVVDLKGRAMRRRDFITLIGGAVTWPVTGWGQTIPVVGFVVSGGQGGASYVTAFKLGLEAVGFVEGQNVVVEYHWLGGHDEGLPALVAELVQRRVAVIFGDTSPAMAAKKATSAIPIVFMTGTDPIGLGLVNSFSHPGGNATGITFLNSALDAKRLGLLHELLPQATVIASLLDPNYPASANQLKDLQNAAVALGQQLQVFQVSSETQIDHAFAAMANVRPDALVVSASGFLGARRKQITEQAARNSLPTMGFDREFIVARWPDQLWHQHTGRVSANRRLHGPAS